MASRKKKSKSCELSRSFFSSSFQQSSFSLNCVWDKIIVRERVTEKHRAHWTLLTHSQKARSANEHAACRHRKSKAHTESDRASIYKILIYFKWRQFEEVTITRQLFFLFSLFFSSYSYSSCFLIFVVFLVLLNLFIHTVVISVLSISISFLTVIYFGETIFFYHHYHCCPSKFFYAPSKWHKNHLKLKDNMNIRNHSVDACWHHTNFYLLL